MRDQVIDQIGQISSALPLWMTSKQADGSVLGFVPAWVIAYINPGRSNEVIYNINENFGVQLNKVDFKADRYELDRSQTHSWEQYDDSTQGHWVPSPPAATTFDIQAHYQLPPDSDSTLPYSGGTGYVVGNQLRILGSDLGGADGTNDCFLEVQSLAGSSLLTVIPTGVVPLGSAQTYTFSIHAKKSTSSSFDMMLIFSGSSTCSARLNFNFDTETFTTAVIGATSTPALAITDKLELSNGWYRISLTANDYNATNTSLQARLYPRGLSGNSGSTRFYGAQLQIGSDATFYLDTQNNRHTSYADFYIKGSGTGVEVIGDEIRSGSNFQMVQ
jgi:hypothetical protein